MKNKLKIIILFLIIIVIVSLGGCASMSIDASITPEHLVTYIYELRFEDMDIADPNYEDAETFLVGMKKNWTNKGFDVEYDNDDDNMLRLTCTMQKQCDTRAEAFETLYEYMTNELSVFDDVDYEYNQDFYLDDYTITSHINLSGMVNEDVYTIYPAIVGEDLDEFLANVAATINISLPYNDSETDGDIEQKMYTQDISFSKPTEIMITGVINNFENAQTERELVAAKKSQLIMLISFSLLALAAIAGLVLLLIKKSKSKAKKIVTIDNKDAADISSEI